MNKAIKVLTVVLVLQVLLVVLANLEHFKPANNNQQARLLAVDWQKIDGLNITGKDSAVLVLKKKSEHEWFMPGYHQLIVEKTKIDELLNKLKALKMDWPVATTEEASRRFEVHRENFQRQLTFLQGETAKSTLRTGTSPGFRKVHARVDDQNPIYAIELSNFLASTNAEDWLKKQILSIDLNAAKKITLGDIHLNKADKEWQLEGLLPEQKLNQTGLQLLLDALTHFSVEAAFGPDAAILENQREIMKISFDLSNEQHQWIFYEPKEGAHLTVKSTQNPNYFKVNRAIADKFTAVTREQLIEKMVSPTPMQTQPNPTEPMQTESMQTEPAQIEESSLPVTP